MMRPIRTVVSPLLAACFLLVPALAQVPSPTDFFGHEIGADYQLVNYTDMVRYFRAVEQASDRMQLVDIGASSYGQRMQMAVISSKANLARIDRLREISRWLAHARGVDAAMARELAAEGRAVVWIDGGLHATETIAGQNIIELVYRMTSRDDAEVRRILDEVVLLACPVNPDGYELVANAYRATRSTTTPVLYQRYVGHDNNRDFYACNQLEAQNVSRVFYRDWCPQIVYNHHQSAPRGTIIYTPPFRDPFNYQIDPLVIRGIEIVSAHVNHRFALEQKPGVISRSGASYSAWWNGGLRSTTYFHNMIGILTEVFGRPEPTPIRQVLSRRLPDHDYPDPVPSQTWHARQTIEYLQTSDLAILDYAAKHRADLLLGIHAMGSRAIGKGQRDHWTATPRLVAEAERRDDDSVWSDPEFRDPRAYVLRRDQPDWTAAVRFARALWHCGVEIHVATDAFTIDGGLTSVPAQSLIVKCDQAYRAHVLDMMEPQWHPDDVRDGKPVPPYDAAGWTLAMQMDVKVERCFEQLDGPFERLVDLPDGSGHVRSGDADFVIDPRDCDSVVSLNQLLARGVPVWWGDDDCYHTVFASTQQGGGEAAAGRRLLSRVRLGLFDTFGGHMATGWDQWLLEQFAFPVQRVWGERIEAGDLGRDFDVLVFHTGLPGPRDLRRAARRRDPPKYAELKQALPPFEDWSDLEARDVELTAEKSLPALREFVQQGGTLIALGGEVEKVVRHFELPIKVGTHVAIPESERPETGETERATTREEFYVPGSLLAIEVDTTHPIARGVSRELAAMVNRSTEVLEVLDPDADIDVVASYRATDTLVSGWAIGTEYLAGKAAVVCARVGKGRILLFGIDATYRGQPLGTAKMLFQGIVTAGEAR